MTCLRWTLLLAILTATAPLAAQEETRSPIDRAREHMERGQALYLQARFEEAATEFEAAYAAQPFSAFLYNAGVALERAGQAERAADLFDQYVAADPRSTDAGGVRERAAALRAALAARPPDAPDPPPDTTPPDGVPEEFKSLLSVRTNPAGATITVHQGERTVAEGPAPFAHTLDQGRYIVRVAHPDYQTVEQEMRIEPGKVYVVIVEMSQGQFLGYLRVVSDVPGAQVFIDDHEAGARGQTPYEVPIPVGTHRVWVERPGYQPQELEAVVGIGDDIALRVELVRVENGRLRVTANQRGARVLIDSHVLGTVPFEGDVSAGPHRLRVEWDGMKAYEAQITIERGQLTPVRARLRPDVGRGGAIVTTVFAGLFLAGGITLAVIGNEYMRTLQGEVDAGTLATDDPRLDEGLIFYIAADSAFGLSLIFGALALYYFIYDPLPPSDGTVLESRDWTFLPLFDPTTQTGGLGVGGAF